MKIAISGKGGVGKTTLASILANIYNRDGYKVLAVDADPDSNLAASLGFSKEEIEKIIPLSEMKDIIAERTGAKPGLFGQMFKLNPKVDDIPERYCSIHDGIKLLVMGTVKKGGSGCVCPEHVFLRALMQHLLLCEKDVLIMDMEAGIEHLGRATADSVDALLVVVEPGERSIQTLESIQRLANDIKIKRVFAVANKVQDQEDLDFIKNNETKIPLLGYISYDRSIMKADRIGSSPFKICINTVKQVESIRKNLEEYLK